MKELTEFEEDVLLYLDEIKKTNSINMYAITWLIRETYGVNKYEARELLKLWMDTYEERRSENETKNTLQDNKRESK